MKPQSCFDAAHNLQNSAGDLLGWNQQPRPGRAAWLGLGLTQSSGWVKHNFAPLHWATWNLSLKWDIFIIPSLCPVIETQAEIPQNRSWPHRDGCPRCSAHWAPSWCFTLNNCITSLFPYILHFQEESIQVSLTNQIAKKQLCRTENKKEWEMQSQVWDWDGNKVSEQLSVAVNSLNFCRIKMTSFCFPSNCNLVCIFAGSTSEFLNICS